jgi:hypothetical protein
MNWLTQNWVWIALAIGAVWLFSRGGLAGCGMGGHGGHGGHDGHGGGTGPAPGGTSGSATGNQGTPASVTPQKEQQAPNVAPAPQQPRHRGC